MCRYAYIVVFVFSVLVSCQNGKDFKESKIEIEIRNWEFHEVGKQKWYNAIVPGTIHTDLITNGIIKDPFVGTNEKDVQWIDKKDWEYQSTFEAGNELLNKEMIKLIFEGLDTYATVYLNDREILKADNMFRSWEVSVKDYITLGENTLRVVLHSPVEMGLKKLEYNGYPLPASNDQSENGGLGDKKVSIFTRKAPYHYGWDWGPRLVTSGIWRSVYLVGYNAGKIENVHIVQHDLTTNKANLEALIEYYSTEKKDSDISVYIDGNEATTITQSALIGSNRFKINFDIDDPELWWPNGMGDQHLYEIEFVISKRQNIIDKMNIATGLCTIELVQKPDDTGKSFYFEVNGRPVFAKGANYIPNDVFLTRVKPEDYERIIKATADANMNMLRVWGGGIYENDIFYDLCDQYGIMVWQDFMYACSMYPGDDEFLDNARLEAEGNIIRLRNHPCIALWCGNNEIEIAWAEYEEGRGWGWKERYTEEKRKEIWRAYDTLFHHILPNAVKQHDPQNEYWHSSPSAGMGELASHTNISGDMHYWGVWHGQEPFEDFRKYKARFMSEYGFQSFPELNTVKTYALPDEWDIESETMAHHQRSGIGNLRIRQYMEEDYLIPEDFKQFLYVSQLLQAEGIKMAIESHRAEKPYCMGTLYWQLNDCWPVASWSGIDYYGRWKALHYFVKKAFKENIVATFQDEENVDLLLLTDACEKAEYQLQMMIIDFNGNILWKDETIVDSNPDSAKLFYQLQLEEIVKHSNPQKMVLVTNLISNAYTKYTDFHYFVKPKDLQLEDPRLDIHVKESGSAFEITLSSKKLAKNVFLSTDISSDHFSDNFFDLLPGEQKKITYPKTDNNCEFEESLKVMHLFQTYQ